MVTTVSTGNVLLAPARLGFNKVAQEAEDSAARLTSGNRILRTSDDASGVSIAARLQTQIFKYRQAIQDVAASDTLVDVAKSGLERIYAKLERAAELAEEANADVLEQERLFFQQQFEAVLQEIDDIVAETTFDSRPVLDGSFEDETIRLGPEDTDFAPVDISDVSTEGLFGPTPPDLTSQANAATAETSVATALETVGSIIGSLSGTQGRLLTASSSISSTLSGVSQAEAEISDTKEDAELLALTESQIKLDVGSAVIAQAARISNDLLSVLDFRIEIDVEPELNEEDDTQVTETESTRSTGLNATDSAEAA